MPERVEVELTPRAPGRRGRRGDVELAPTRVPVVDPPAVDDGDDVPPPFEGAPVATSEPAPTSDDRRLWTVALAVGVTALALGWVLGRAGGSGADVAAPTPTSVAPVTTVAGATIPEVDDLDDRPEARGEGVAPAESARPAPTTMAIDPDPPIRIDDRLLGKPFEVVTLAPGRKLLEIDLLTGIVDERHHDGLVFGQPSLYIGEDWALILTPFEARPSILFEGDGEAVETEVFGDNSPVLARAGEEFFWRLDGGLMSAGAGVAEELDRRGVPTGRTMELPRVPRAIDPAGGLIVEIPGGTFSIGHDGMADRITTGRLLAVSEASALAQECDEQLMCEYVVIDRSTRERTAVPLPPELAASVELSGEDWWNVASPFSPDDAAAALVWHRQDSAMLVVIELVTGDLVELAQVRGPASATWAPDGSYLFFLDGTRLRAWQRATGELFDVVDVPVEIGVGVRSAGPG